MRSEAGKIDEMPSRALSTVVEGKPRLKTKEAISEAPIGANTKKMEELGEWNGVLTEGEVRRIIMITFGVFTVDVCCRPTNSTDYVVLHIKCKSKEIMFGFAHYMHND